MLRYCKGTKEMHKHSTCMSIASGLKELLVSTPHLSQNLNKPKISYLVITAR